MPSQKSTYELHAAYQRTTIQDIRLVENGSQPNGGIINILGLGSTVVWIHLWLPIMVGILYGVLHIGHKEKMGWPPLEKDTEPMLRAKGNSR
jgi:hypothetical protein